jgi:hypothetical protein
MYPELQSPSYPGEGTSNQQPLTEYEQDQNKGKLPDVFAIVYCPSLILIIRGIQSRRRDPLYHMNNNKDNHIIDSVASTVIPGQAMQDVLITSQGQAEDVPLRYQSQPLHCRLLEMKRT